MTLPSFEARQSAVASRRRFLRHLGLLVAGTVLVTRRGQAQDAAAAAQPAEMTSDSYKPVVRPAKPDARPTMNVKQVEDFERNLACPCPCTLDIYTCRTTDFQCGISPAVHGDIQRLVDGGYTADEIMLALTDTYGDFILNAPRKEGFSLLAWFAPFAAVAFGALGIGALLRSWRVNAKQAATVRAAGPVSLQDTGVDATPDELARLEAAMRDER